MSRVVAPAPGSLPNTTSELPVDSSIIDLHCPTFGCTIRVRKNLPIAPRLATPEQPCGKAAREDTVADAAEIWNGTLAAVSQCLDKALIAMAGVQMHEVCAHLQEADELLASLLSTVASRKKEVQPEAVLQRAMAA